MDKYPKIAFTKSLQTETERIIQASIQVANGFYKNKGFLVLPKLINKDANEVVLPKLNYQSIKHYWQTLKTLISQFPTKAPQTSIKAIEKLLINTHTYTDNINLQLEENWQTIEPQFWQYLKLLLPKPAKQISSIEVRLTDFGSIASWWLNKNHLICYLRKDATIGHLAEAIITTLIRTDKQYQYSWESSEAIVDFFLTNSSIAPLIKGYQPTHSSLLKTTQALRKRSDLYLQSLGVTYKQKSLTLHNHQIMLKGKKINQHLTKKQTIVLKFLLKNRNELVSSDDLADELWGQDDFKSLWALNKSVQRLRSKLSSLGFPQENLKVVRGQGYVLVA